VRARSVPPASVQLERRTASPQQHPDRDGVPNGRAFAARVAMPIGGALERLLAASGRLAGRHDHDHDGQPGYGEEQQEH
jgi:hypothetical protein